MRLEGASSGMGRSYWSLSDRARGDVGQERRVVQHSHRSASGEPVPSSSHELILGA
ncbi:MAG TPA: hypothetical protein VHJ79_07065 [Mycobacterium sp.]|jgi:hypothetical protein|nr:hypothetical protein [Mycobacterium sp.]